MTVPPNCDERCRARMPTTNMIRTLAWLVLSLALQRSIGCSFERYPLLGPQQQDPSVADAVSAPSQPSGNTSGAIPSLEPIVRADDASQPANARDAGSALSDAAPALDASSNVDGPDASALTPASTTAPDAANSAPDAPSPVSDATTPSTTPADPTPAHRCRAGTYAGDFTCTLDATGVTPLSAMARVTFTLRQAPSGTALTVVSSSLAFDLTGFRFVGELSGALDCTAGTFQAQIINGTFMSEWLPVPTEFTGSVDGELRGAGSLAGSWSFTALSGVSCTGPWSASLQP
jgi:hypothetical protein